MSDWKFMISKYLEPVGHSNSIRILSPTTISSGVRMNKACALVVNDITIDSDDFNTIMSGHDDIKFCPRCRGTSLHKYIRFGGHKPVEPVLECHSCSHQFIIYMK